MHKTYVTALDREDVTALADALLSVVAHAETAIALLATYRLGRAREHARRVRHVVAAAGDRVRDGVAGLRRLDGTAACVADLRAIGDDGRRAVREALGELAADEPPAVELITWRDVYEQLACVLSACEHATAALHAIELKGR